MEQTNKIFDLVNNVVIIKPETLNIKPFKALWLADKTKDKSNATKDIHYIWYFTDFDSPYFEYDDLEKTKLIKEQILEDIKYKPSKEVLDAIRVYQELNNTPTIQLLEAANGAIFKMKEYFKDIDFSEDDIDKVSRAVTNMPKMIEAINKAKELCRKEKAETTRNRGGYSEGLFES
jgi:hypothetical protein